MLNKMIKSSSAIEQKVLVTPEKAYTDAWLTTKQYVQDSISSYFPVNGRVNTLKLNGIEIDDKLDPMAHFKSQAEAKNTGRTWGVPVYGDMSLVDKEGKEINRTRIKLCTLPKQTPRYSYIVDGSEWQVEKQWQLKSGIYSRIQENGDKRAEFNLLKPFAKEARLYIPFDAEKKKYKLKYATANYPLYSVLKALNISDDQMKKAWGEDIYKTNVSKDYKKDITKFYNNQLKARGVVAETEPGKPTSYENIEKAIRKAFDETGLLEETTKITMGKPYDKVTGEALLHASSNILDVEKGVRPPDNIHSLAFKKLRDIEDYIKEKYDNRKILRSLQSKIRNNLDRKSRVAEIISSDLFNKPLKQVFTSSSLSQRAEQVNPLEMLSNRSITTITGEGGLKNERAIRPEMKIIDSTHFGFLDPIHTPESEKTGISLHLPLAVKKIGNEAKTLVFNTETKKMEYINPTELHSNKVILPDQIKWGMDRKPIIPDHPIKMLDPITHEFSERPGKEAKYVLPSAKGLFDDATNLIPFLQNNQGNRAMTGSRQATQAVSLTDREAPLVQVQAENPALTWEKKIGHLFSHVYHGPEGVVKEIKRDEMGHPDTVVVKGHDGHERALELYNHFPLNDAKTHINATLKVKVGDVVKKGDLLADTNYTQKGVLSLGTNLNVGYFPYKGLTFEDGLVISETGAQKLASEHLHKVTLELDPRKDIVNKSKFMAYAQTTSKKLTKEQTEKLDSGGIIKPGTKIKPNDVLIAAIGKNEPTGQLAMVGSRLKGAINPFKDKSLKWDSDYEGEIIRVVKHPSDKEITVYVKTREPLQVGDKVVGRHGNKGVVGAIIPDTHMPRAGGPESKPLDMIMNPSGIASRINIGQMLETAASKIALKTGKPYIVNNFGGKDVDYTEKLKKDLHAHGLSDTDKIWDPVDKRYLTNEAMTGHQYIMKLKHTSEKKLSVRGMDNRQYGINQEPKGGGDHGAQSLGHLEMYALLASGARHNLKEITTYKAERPHNSAMADEDFWLRVQQGQPLPPPKPTFAYRKFENLLMGLGLNIKKDGHVHTLIPMTDHGVLKISNGEIKDAGMMRGKNEKELAQGLFDPKITGGIPTEAGKGLHWSHYKLPEPMPNPVFIGQKKMPGPAVLLTGLKFDEFEEIAKGKKEINGKTGGAAIHDMLAKINIKQELQKVRDSLPKLKGAELNKTNRKARYLMALDKLNMKPQDAYMMNYIPIVPPVFRPLVPMEDGRVIFSDINYLYKQTIMTGNQLKTIPKEMPEEEKTNLRSGLYDRLKAIAGLGAVPLYEGNRKLKGIIQEISGDNPKTGFFQAKIMKRRQELSMRGAITPEPAMHIDQVGLPRTSAMELYKPFVIRELMRMGRDVIDARREVKDNSDYAKRALDNVVLDRPVLLKRDPVLHKYNIQAFKPILVDGNSVKLHPLVCGSFNADFDGDEQINHVIIFCLENDKNKLIQSDMIEQEWFDHRKIDMYQTKLPYIDNGNFYIVDLEDFPYQKDKLLGIKDHIEFYEAMPYLKVFAYDEIQNSIVLADVTGWSIHYDREVWLINLKNGKQIISDDDERAVYGVLPRTLQLTRRRPEESIGMLVPQSKYLDDVCPHGQLTQVSGRGKLKELIHLNGEAGYVIGALAGDGWYDEAKERYSRVNLAGIVQPIINRFSTYLPHIFKEMPHIGHVESFLSYGKSQRHTISSVDFAEWVAPMIGKGAKNKHLPVFWFTAPEEFKWGLLSGLLDTDGSICITHGKSKPQLQANISSCSIRLLQETQHMLQTLNIRSRITFSKKTSVGNDFWILSISSVDLIVNMDKLSIVHPANIAALNNLEARPKEDAASSIKTDLVPIDVACVEKLMKLAYSKDKSLYAILSKAKNDGYLTRVSAHKALDFIKGTGSRTMTGPIIGTWPNFIDCPSMFNFVKIVFDNSTTWVPVESIENTGIKETGYDLTVPGYETFMSVDGIILSNTMAAYLPVTEEARKEALEKMLPSKNLFSATHYGVMHAPDQEAVLGIHLLTNWGKKVDKSYKSFAELKADKSLHIHDVVTLNGKETTLGRQILAEKLPEKFKTPELLHSPEYTLKKGSIHGLLEDIAKHDSKGYPDIVNHLKDLGNKYSYDEGFSFRLKDLNPLKQKRGEILKPYEEQAHKVNASNMSQEDKDAKLVDIFSKATVELDKTLHAEYKTHDNNIFKMVDTKARGSAASFRQMNIAPMLMKDALNRTIPVPIKRSFAEGLDIGDYWLTLHGARKGTLQRVEGTSEPGKLTKEIVNLNVSTLITKNDCGTTKGTSLALHRPDGKEEEDINDRFTVKPIQLKDRIIPSGSLITPEIHSALKAHNITHVDVRSPLTCQEAHGICSKCFGLNENGKLHEAGTNIGVLASQSMGEPATQLAMDSTLGTTKVKVLLNNENLEISLEDLFKTIKTDVMNIDNKVETKWCNNLKVWDGYDYVDVYTIQRYLCDDYMVEIKCLTGESLSVKRTHPCLVLTEKGEIIKSADQLLGEHVVTSKGVSIVNELRKFEWDGLVYDITTSSKAYMGDNIRTHNSFHCNHAKSIVFIRETTKILAISLEELFDKINSPSYFEGEKEYKDISHLEIFNGQWVKLHKVCRHIPDSTMVAYSDSKQIGICQDTHPIAVFDHTNRCHSCGYHRLVKPSRHDKTTKWRCTKCWKFTEMKSIQVTSMRFEEPRNLKDDSVYLHYSFPSIPEEIIWPIHDPYLVGMFISEGNCTYYKNKATSIIITQNTGPIHNKIEAHLKKLNYEYKYSPDKRSLGRRFILPNKRLAKEFHESYGRYSWNKALPSDFLYYPNEWLIEFLCAFIEGDGCVNHRKIGTEQIILDTTSFELAQQLYMICLKLGIVANMLTTPNRAKTDHQGYRVTIRITQYVKDLLKNCYKMQFVTKLSPNQEPSIEGYRLLSYVKPVLYTEKYVYDVTTESGTAIVSGLLGHNTGGVAASRGGGSVDKFERLDQILHIPKTLPGAATLSSKAGKIEKIIHDPSTNSHNIIIDGQKHFIPRERKVTVNLGDEIKKGQQLSDGNPNPRDLLKYKGIGAVRDYLANSLKDEIYKDDTDVRRRNLEVVVRNLTNHTKIVDPGDSHHMIGDTVHITHVEDFNRKISPNQKPIRHAPMIEGISQAAVHKDEDYLSRFNFRYIKENLVQAASQGWSTHLRGKNPVGPIAAGTIGTDRMPGY